MSIWAIKSKDDYQNIPDVAEIQILLGTKRSDLLYKDVSNVVFYPSMKMLEFDTSSGQKIMTTGKFLLKFKF